MRGSARYWHEPLARLVDSSGPPMQRRPCRCSRVRHRKGPACQSRHVQSHWVAQCQLHVADARRLSVRCGFTRSSSLGIHLPHDLAHSISILEVLLASLPSRSQDGSQSSWFDCTVVVRSFNWGGRRFIGNAEALCDGAPRTMSTEPRYRSPQPNQRLRVSPMLRTAAWMPGPPRLGNSTCASMARSVSARCVKSPTTCSALCAPWPQ